jgi:hypothetical protein
MNASGAVGGDETCLSLTGAVTEIVGIAVGSALLPQNDQVKLHGIDA